MDERMACSPNEDILRQQSNEMVWISAAIFARVPVFMASSYSVIPWISLYLKTNIPSVPVVFKCSYPWKIEGLHTQVGLLLIERVARAWERTKSCLWHRDPLLITLLNTLPSHSGAYCLGFWSLIYRTIITFCLTCCWEGYTSIYTHMFFQICTQRQIFYIKASGLSCCWDIFTQISAIISWVLYKYWIKKPTSRYKFYNLLDTIQDSCWLCLQYIVRI